MDLTPLMSKNLGRHRLLLVNYKEIFSITGTFNVRFSYGEEQFLSAAVGFKSSNLYT
jgi:hypothetical protein